MTLIVFLHILEMTFTTTLHILEMKSSIRGERGTLGECCQYGNVATANVANFQLGTGRSAAMPRRDEGGSQLSIGITFSIDIPKKIVERHFRLDNAAIGIFSQTICCHKGEMTVPASACLAPERPHLLTQS